VKVTGKLGDEPVVDFTAPLAPASTQRTVAIQGKTTKDVASTNDEVQVDFALYNGATGDRLTATSYAKGDQVELPVNDKILPPGLIKTLECATTGTRIVGVIPAAEGYGDEGSAQLGVAGGESLVFVVDIVGITPGVATGKPQPPVEGMPTVKVAKDGTPTITVPDADPPAEFKLAVLKKGDGDVVADGDTVRLQYLGVNWNTGKVFDQSWDKQGVVSFMTAGVVPGFSKALIGQAAGSQVVVVIPPELGYGPSGGTEDGSIGATDTIIFVIDILGTTPPEE
jgi:peptidylprolyl isomerase